MSAAEAKHHRPQTAKAVSDENDVQRQIDALADMSNAQLRALWVKLGGDESLPLLRRNFFIRMVAYRIQEKAYGGLSREIRAHLKRLVEQSRNAQTATAPLPKMVPRPSLGTRLIREWQGQVHEVTVIDTGYAYRGQRHKSLSEIARLITGTNWSGPLFFGLKQDSSMPVPNGRRASSLHAR